MLAMTTDAGETFFGRNAHELVERMRETVWDPPGTLDEYMADVAERVGGMTGRPLRLDPDGFLADLEIAGLVRVRQAH